MNEIGADTIKEMKKTEHFIRRRIDEKITGNIDMNLTLPQIHVIGYISDKSVSTGVFQKDIEKEFGLQRSSVSLMLSNMEKNGFIERVSVERDARLKQILLTEKAIALRKIILEEIRIVNDEIFKGISEQDKAKFVEILIRIQENLQ